MPIPHDTPTDHGLRFALFGPLTVTRDGRTITIPQTKHRVVLAALLLRADRLVTVEDLTTHLWDDAPPVTARKTLQGYVARLRKKLGHEVLVSHPAGYRIAARPDQLDLGRFASLAAEADRTQDADARARLLRAALDTAAGPPLADSGTANGPNWPSGWCTRSSGGRTPRWRSAGTARCCRGCAR